MSHMLADTEEELHAMAAKIGLKRGWFQPLSTPHYDVSQTKRREALDNGAVEIGNHDLVALIRRLRGERLTQLKMAVVVEHRIAQALRRFG